MGNYIIKRIDFENIKYLVVGTSVESPLFYMSEIEKDINDIKEVNVLFDQLLQTGNSDNRFLLIKLKNGLFELNSAKSVSSEDMKNNIKIEISEFLRNNPKVLNYSILSSEQKKFIEEGGII